MFHCISPDIGHICFYFDYIGIAFLGLVQAIANYHYSRPEGLPFYEWSLPYIINIEVIACSVGSYVYCASQHWDLMQLRTAVSLFVYVVGIIPLLQRMWYAQQWESELTMHLTHILLAFMGLAVYVLHVPERFWPRAFDYVGHSHEIFHVLISGSMFVHVYAASIDMVTRRKLLDGNETMVSGVFWPVRTLSAAQVIVIGIFAYHLLNN
jgi:predicted membrane channel-forming protein YqfA (hemolysin III family)